MKNLDPLKLYTDMLRIRFVEETISQEYSKQEMRCPVHLSIGQEAIPVGVSSRLTISDQIVSAHRSHAHYLSRSRVYYLSRSHVFCSGRSCVHYLIKSQVNYLSRSHAGRACII